jgi:hypothetical protein
VTTYYVGLSGSDAANGLSWANRKLTLNGAENVPVAAGDTIYVGPGAYRESLTIDVSGSSGNPITYIADVTGQNTDGIGGVVRITGSNNDTTVTRASCITAASKNYRTFRGFALDMASGASIDLSGACSNWVLEDCYFAGTGNVNTVMIAGTGTTHTVRRCIFHGSRLRFDHSSVVDNSAHVVENCLFIGALSDLVTARVGGIAVKNCLVFGTSVGIRVLIALTVGQTTTVNNCIFAFNVGAVRSVTAPGTNEEITENYNSFYGNTANYTSVSTGANSNTYAPLLEMPAMLDGFAYPWRAFALSQWSAIRALAGTSMASEDVYGITRPATASKNSWGPVQYVSTERETTTVRTGTASIKLSDAGRHQMFVPTTAVSTVFSVYVQWEADYAGTKPTMTIKQPGQSDTVVTATGGASTWELLTTTLTPAASPGYCIVELASHNTATSTVYDVFFDDLTVA